MSERFDEIVASERWTSACDTVERWLHDSDELEPTPSISSHLADCRSCWREFADRQGYTGSQRQGLQSLANQDPSRGLADELLVRSVLARIRQEPTPNRRRYQGVVARFAAASLLLSALGIWIGVSALSSSERSTVSKDGVVSAPSLDRYGHVTLVVDRDAEDRHELAGFVPASAKEPGALTF